MPPQRRASNEVCGNESDIWHAGHDALVPRGAPNSPCDLVPYAVQPAPIACPLGTVANRVGEHCHPWDVALNPA